MVAELKVISGSYLDPEVFQQFFLCRIYIGQLLSPCARELRHFLIESLIRSELQYQFRQAVVCSVVRLRCLEQF